MSKERPKKDEENMKPGGPLSIGILDMPNRLVELALVLLGRGKRGRTGRKRHRGVTTAAPALAGRESRGHDFRTRRNRAPAL